MRREHNNSTGNQSNILIYHGNNKLEYYSLGEYEEGMCSEAFVPSTILSHEFSNGIGKVTFTSDVTQIGVDDYAAICDYGYYDYNVTFLSCEGEINFEDYGLDCRKLISVNFPNCKSVGRNVFAYNNSLESINLPKCSCIGMGAFDGCDSLSVVNLPTCDYIEEGAFYDCTSLSQLTISSKISCIMQETFYGCSSLSQISLPNCETICYSAFQRAGLTTISLPKCDYLQDYAFNWCSKLTTVYLPNLTSVPIGAFNCCLTLSSINLSNCNRIDANAFNCAYSLTTISLPKVYSIERSVFYNCSRLSSVYLLYSRRCTLVNSTAFVGTPIASGTGKIYVPASLVYSYQIADNWSYYSSRIFSY